MHRIYIICFVLYIYVCIYKLIINNSYFTIMYINILSYILTNKYLSLLILHTVMDTYDFLRGPFVSAICIVFNKRFQ